MKIRQLRSSDLDFAAGLTAAEGWDSETRLEIESFTSYDPAGCFIAEIEDERIGMCVGMLYQGFGFLGELIVAPKWRQLGLGRALLDHTVGYLQAGGARTVFLDGVIAALPLYKRAGFVPLCRSWRFSGILAGKGHTDVRLMKTADLDVVSKLDRSAFGADRRFFLERRLQLYPRFCMLLEVNGRIQGYIMARRGRSGVSVGPWIVLQNTTKPLALLESLAFETGETALRIGVLDIHKDSQTLLEKLGFEKSLQSPWRMALGKAGLPGDTTLVYSIGSPAKG
jgi:GNAT superfamily N-acetyltransferase